MAWPLALPGRGGCHAMAGVGRQALGRTTPTSDWGLGPDGWRDQGLDLSWGGEEGEGTCPCVPSWS